MNHNEGRSDALVINLIATSNVWDLEALHFCVKLTIYVQRVPFTISWDIIGRAAPYNPATNKCRLCLLEKYLIMFKPAGASLNQNSEFFTTCRHKESHLLGKVKFKKWKSSLTLPFFHLSFSNHYICVIMFQIFPSDLSTSDETGDSSARNNVVK